MSEVEFRLEAPELPGHWGIVHARLEEAIDRPYSLRIELRSDGSEPLAAEDWMEQDVVFELRREGATPRRVTGMILGIEHTRLEERDGEAGLVLEVGPALSLLGLTRQSRIFQEKSVPDILQEVFDEALGAYGRSIDKDLKATYEPREYCVQWQETDREFVERLMTEEGISYHFDHAGETEVLVLRDENSGFADLEANEGASVPFATIDERMQVIPEAITRFAPRLSLGRTKVSVRDYDWSLPQSPEGSEGDADAKGRERESFEHGLGVTLSIGSYDEGARRYQKNDAARQPKLRLEADQAGLKAFEAISTVLAIGAGKIFELTASNGHDGRYLVTRVELDGSGAESHRFECIPVDVIYRPRRVHRKPKISSAEIATVVGPAGEEIHTDAHGRIMVRFPWDRSGSADDAASCWIRVAQRWAGASFGTMHIPRIGMEVVVRYVHGDPDRPLVTGCVYNGVNPTPYPLPDEKTKSTIKSNSSLGGSGFNELRYEDKAGDEQIFLHAQKNLDEVVLANHTTAVGADQTNTVHNNQTQTIHTNQTEDVHGKQELTVGGNRTVIVNGGFEETIDGTESRKVLDGEVEMISGGHTRTVTGAVTELLLGKETRTVTSGLTETNGASHTRTTIGSADRSAGGAFSHKASGIVQFSAGGNVSSSSVGGHTIDGPTVTFTAPDIFEFSNDHKQNATTTTEDIGTKIAIYGFSFGLTPLGLSLGGLKIDLTGVSKSATGLKASVTGVTLDTATMANETTGASAKAIGLVIGKAGMCCVG